MKSEFLSRIAMLLPFSRRQRALQEERCDAAGEETFVLLLSERGIAPNVSRAVYSRIMELASFPEFKLLPQDCLGNVFGTVDEDLDEVVENIFRDLSIPVPRSSGPRQRDYSAGEIAEIVDRHYRQAQRQAETLDQTGSDKYPK